MSIASWIERCEKFDDMHITTHKDVRQAMLSEIDDLRADLAAAKAETQRIILSANEAAAILGDQCEKMEEERDDALRDLAAAKALLQRVLTCGLNEGYGSMSQERKAGRLFTDISLAMINFDAALAKGEK